MFTKSVSLSACGIFAAPLLVVFPAQAAVFVFQYSGTDAQNTTVSGSGTLTTADAPNKKGYYAVTSVTGQQTITDGNGQKTSGALSVIDPYSYYSGNNDNLLSAKSPYFTSGGLGLRYGSDYDDTFTLFSYQKAVYYNGYNANPKLAFSISAAPAAVPELASWAMTIVGFGLIGAASRKCRHPVSAPIA